MVAGEHGFHRHFVLHRPAQAAGVADHQWRFVREGKDCDGFVRRCGAAEEIDPTAFRSGMLIGQNAQRATTGDKASAS